MVRPPTRRRTRTRTRTRARARPRKRRIDYPRRGRSNWLRWIPSWRQVLGTFLVGIGLLAGLFTAVYLSVDIPGENAETRKQASVYYWADGSQMVSVGAVNRQNVTLADIPDSVESAVIAAENESFYSDSGVSMTGIARAVTSMISGGETQGGSTITQQYVKNTYLSQDQTAKRKLNEFFISLKLDNQKTKREILEGYLNTSWFGRGAYGIQAAANAYYGIPAKKLNPSQSAVLAALLKGAEEYDPAGSGANHQRAVARWKWILDRQVKTGGMDESERARYKKYPEPKKVSVPNSLGGQTGYLIDIANKYIKQRSGVTEKDIAQGNYRIHTTFDKKKTRQLEQAVKGVRKRQLDPEKRSEDRHVEIGAASVRPSDGAVIAVYGGADATKHFANNADTAGVPVGSAFKPFVLAAALEHGVGSGGGAGDSGRQGAREKVTLDSSYDSHGRLLPGVPNQAPALTPSGESGGFLYPAHGNTSLRMALVDSKNATFVQLGKDVGLETIRDTAVAAGLRKESMARLESTFPLGTSTPSAVRMADAYTTFPNSGTRADPYSVTKVLWEGEAVEGFAKPHVQRVMDSSVARDIHDALRRVAWRAVDLNALKNLGDIQAGRTGSEDRMKSAWYIGSGDGLTTAVTVFRTKPGTPQLLPMQGVGGPKSERGNVLPPKIWSDYVTSKS